MEERSYRGEERRRRWPGAYSGEERRMDPIADLQTDQEPDQSPLAQGVAAPAIPSPGQTAGI